MHHETKAYCDCCLPQILVEAPSRDGHGCWLYILLGHIPHELDVLSAPFNNSSTCLHSSRQASRLEPVSIFTVYKDACAPKKSSCIEKSVL